MDSVKKLLHDTIQKLEQWSTKACFKFSTSKTKTIHFSKHKNVSTHPRIKLANITIEFLKRLKYLCLTSDSKLTWKTILRFNKRMFTELKHHETLVQLKWGADREWVILLYKAVIRSKLEYGTIVFGTAKQTIIKSLDKIQCTTIRTAIGAHRPSPIGSMLCEASKLPLYLRTAELKLNYAA